MATNMMNNVLVSCLMFFLMIGSLNAKSADIKAICGKAKNPTFCKSYMMKSEPKTSGADIKTLATITFGSAQTSASGALTKIQSLATKETNPALKKAYTSCVEQYKNTISSLDEAKKSLESGDGPGLNIKVSAAMEGSTTCQDGFVNVKADPSVTTEIDDFQNICSIVLVISNMM
ncbi:unnamed protein product [Eruca vesicaria subsp. sativa]|uniref:Pectinesterase inhibitor domain-containing protein n=1 Tax=Eruca vesicaria subsp. sativa TaxID=29727 RepID=A0ABC8L059_ERUVS|nr:unnamed protein product [Eruca vesicaria subsp. sativa]